MNPDTKQPAAGSFTTNISERLRSLLRDDTHDEAQALTDVELATLLRKIVAVLVRRGYRIHATGGNSVHIQKDVNL